jgi:SWI/SNF-related matrix-associated actin-dependent regulator 1 of chromatin subfamily A
VINATKGMAVVVCPAGLKLNWANELASWLVEPRDKVVILSYHEAAKFANLVDLRMGVLVVDEAHYIKNPESQRSQVISALAEKAERVVLLTGTPMENRPVELWPLLKIVAPDKFDPPHLRIGTISLEQRKTHPGEGPGFWAFAARYCDLKTTSFKVGRYWKNALDYSGASNLEELREKLRRTCMVRRLKADVLDQLPDKRRQIIVLPAPDAVDDTGYLEGLTFENYEETLSRLTADKVAFSEFSKKRHDQGLMKVDSCLRFIGDALDESDKIIVFAHHKDVIAKLASGIEAELPTGDYAVTVSGETHVADRGAAVKAFQGDKQCRVFIGSIGAAGVGITLTAASHVIFCELDPVPGKMSQAEDRAHRIGQKNSVLVQHLVMDRTLCARMAKIVVRKQAIIKEALDG